VPLKTHFGPCLPIQILDHEDHVAGATALVSERGFHWTGIPAQLAPLQNRSCVPRRCNSLAALHPASTWCENQACAVVMTGLCAAVDFHIVNRHICQRSLLLSSSAAHFALFSQKKASVFCVCLLPQWHPMCGPCQLPACAVFVMPAALEHCFLEISFKCKISIMSIRKMAAHASRLHPKKFHLL